MEHGKYIIDAAAIAATISSVAGWLPPLAAGLSALWLMMQIIINWRKFKYALREMMK